ncbi:hypothetical protein [Comamonas sp. JC664]|uniref:hypothetical protein n=1 Tax=Comamonas sp. JC664 TaxID=2801917 RepID=UPI001749A7E1|nr:hypothetical protein [Comamonas sp. JC664]MBL0694346.1 hypothetical protein [Comamonas sp. JC664]GHG77106.1 hypothetical protein GCM10012319_26790 [Comamonas sp. KCTC 72670]
MRILPWLFLAMLTGCASTLSTQQTARTLAPGQVQVTGGVGAFVPVGTIVRVVEEGREQGREAWDAIVNDRPYALGEEAQQRILTAGVALMASPPGVNPELMLRVGVLDGLDVGVRYSGISLRGDLKVRLAHGGDTVGRYLEPGQRSFDLAMGVGVSRHFFSSPVLDVLEVVEMNDFGRYDIEVPVYLSADWGDIFKLYAAPKYIYSRTRMDARLVDYSQQGKPVSGFDATLPATVGSHFVGSTLGIGVGYRYVHLFAEVTAGYFRTRPQLFGQPRDLGGIAVMPSVGLAIRAGGSDR